MEDYMNIVSYLEWIDGENITSFVELFRRADEKNDRWVLSFLCSYEGAFIVSKFLESKKEELQS